MTEIPAYAIHGKFKTVATLRLPGGEPFHPDQHVGDPEIIKVDGTYHLFMSIGIYPNGQTIYRCTGPTIEGPWSPPEAVIVPGIGTPGASDAQACETFAMVELPKDFRIPGTRRAFVACYAGGNGYHHPNKYLVTHGAYTLDPTLGPGVWTKQGITAAPMYWWEQGYRTEDNATYTVGAEESLALKDGDNVNIYALYSSLSKNSFSKGPGVWNRSIGFMASSDAGRSWGKHYAPVIEPDYDRGHNFASQPCLRWDPRGGWHCWYSLGGGPMAERGICHAWSPDLLVWHQDPNNPVVPQLPSPISFQGHVGASSVLLEDQKWKIVHHRKAGTTPNAGEILLAEVAA